MKAQHKQSSILSAALVLVLSLAPAIALAACTSNTGSGSLLNPVTMCNIQDFVAKALQTLVLIALPIIGFFIVIAGFQFIWARGNQAALSKAKQNFMYVIIGACLVLGAWVLATLIGSTISQLMS